MVTEITSSSLIPIETSFRLKAGPGAGKTYWLINHVRNVMSKAELGKRGKIGCFSYSNIGADTISSRLGKCDRVDVSTLHSFLYTNLIGPYLYLIADDFGFNMNKFSGVVDDYVISDYPTMERLQKELRSNPKTSKTYLDPKLWNDYLIHLRWYLSKEEGKLSCRSSKPINDKYPAPSSLGIMYKKVAWNHGILHYDDVNFFAYKLLVKYPFLSKVISKSYPYIFIDEFQDTNPIQSDIISRIGNAGGIIGVIGDVAQSIYGFMGAKPKSFLEFTVPGLKEYVIKNNRRSLRNIVEFLNALRMDLKQESIFEESGDKVCFIVGSKEKAFRFVSETKGINVAVLSYSNVETNSLRYQFLENRGEIPIVKIKDFKDSNASRFLIVTSFVKAIEHARSGKFKKAFSCLERAGFSPELSISFLKVLLSKDDIDNLTMIEFVETLIKIGIPISRITKGDPKKTYSNYKYGQIAQTVSIEDDDCNQRTIHKAKGDEFENVLVLMGSKFDIDRLFNFDLLGDKNEPNRVYYVAMSRAMRRLFVNIQSLSDEVEQKINTKFNIDVIRL